MFYTFPSFEKLKTSLLTSCHHIDPCVSIIVDRAPTTTPPTLSTTATQAPSTPSASVPPPSKRSFPIFSNSNQMFRRAPMCANWGWILTRWRSNSRIRSLTSAHQTGFSHQIDPKTTPPWPWSTQGLMWSLTNHMTDQNYDVRAVSHSFDVCRLIFTQPKYGCLVSSNNCPNQNLLTSIL